jgi:hypothetical protein
MNRSLARVRIAVGVLGLSLGVFAMGCNPAALSYFLFKGDGKAPAAHPLAAADGRQTITLALMLSSPNAPVEFAGIDRDLTSALGRVFAEQSVKMKAPIRVIEQSKIDRFKMATPGWKTMHPSEVGRILGADYVVEATVSNLGLYEPGTGKLMYQGQGTVTATVYDSAAGKEFCNYYVNARLEAKPSDAVPVSQYKGMLIQRIAEEVSWKHLPHVSDRRVRPVE